MVLLETDGLVSLVAGVEGEQGKRDDDVPDVGGAAVDRHRVFVVPFVGETRAAAQNALGGLIATGQPSRQIDQTSLRGVGKEGLKGITVRELLKCDVK